MSLQSDLIKDSKLETEFHDKYTSHIFHEATSRQRKLRREYWTREQYIARGGFGKVWRERCVRGHGKGEVRAVKQVPRPAKAKDYLRELEAIAKFSHPRYVRCFVKSFGWYEDDDHLYIAMEYLPEGDLYHYLAKGQRLPELEAQQITFQLVEALSYMHENGFAHRDLKPHNILITSKPPEEWWVKIADFGICKRAGDLLATHSTIKGTPAYMAPEAQRYIDAQEGEPTGADIWALGEIVHNMLTLKPTFDGNLRERELFKYVEGLRSFSTVSLNEAGASDVAIEFIRAAMKPEPSKRMTVQQALEHEWMGVFTRETSRPASILSLNIGETNGAGQATADDEFLLGLSEASARWTTIQSTVEERHSGQGSPTLTLNAQQPPVTLTSDHNVIQHRKVKHAEQVPLVLEPGEGSSVPVSTGEHISEASDVVPNLPSLDSLPRYVSQASSTASANSLTSKLSKLSKMAAIMPPPNHNHPDKAAPTTAFTISCDGKWVITVRDEHPPSAKIWQASTGELYQTLCPLPGYVFSRSVLQVAFSPTADILAVRFEGDSPRTHIYNIHSRALMRTINHRGSVERNLLVEFSTDGQYIAYNTASSVVVELVAEGPKSVPYFRLIQANAQAIKLDDKHLAVAFENLIEIWDVGIKAPYKKIRLHSYLERHNLIQPQWSRDLTTLFFFTSSFVKPNEYCGKLWARGEKPQSRHDSFRWKRNMWIKDRAQMVTALSHNEGWLGISKSCSCIAHTRDRRVYIVEAKTGAPLADRTFAFNIRALMFVSSQAMGKDYLAVAGYGDCVDAIRFELWDFHLNPYQSPAELDRL